MQTLLKKKKKKYDTNELTYKTETDSQTESKLMVTKGERQEERETRTFGINIYTLLYVK